MSYLVSISIYVRRWLTLGLISDDKWEEDKEDIKEDVEDFPEDAARWTGEKVSLIPARGLPVLLLFTDIDDCV